MSVESWTERLGGRNGAPGTQSALASQEAQTLKALAAEINALAGQANGPEALVRTAIPLSIEEKARFQDVIARRYAVHRINFEVDPVLIGGVWLRVGERIIDDTLRTRLRALRRQLGSSEE